MTTSTASAPAPRTVRGAMQRAGLALLAYAAFNLALPYVPLPQKISGAAVFGLGLLSTLAFMLLQLWLAQAVVTTRPRPAASGGLAAACVVLGVLFYRLSLPYGPYPPVGLEVGLGLTVTLACTFLGVLLSPIIREPNVLLPVALISMPIDYLGAMTAIGFTHDIVRRHPGIVKPISIPVPSVGGAANHLGLAPIAFIGPGDALFVAFFFAVVLRLNMNIRGTFWWIYGLLTATMLFVLSPWGFNIAALVPMGLAVLLANFRYFKLKREEVFATLYAGILILALVTGFYFYAHSRFVRADTHGITTEGTTDAKPASPHSNPAPGGAAANR